MTSCRRTFAIVILISFGIILSACGNSQISPTSPPNIKILPTVTLTIPFDATVETPEEIIVATPVPTGNGSDSEYIATLPIASVNNHATQQEIARLLFTQWLNHFKKEGKFDDYELLNVDIPNGLSFLAKEKSVDFVATVAYSVKPSINAHSYWAAGNGIISTEDAWIRNKGLIIGVYKDNDVYSMLGIGTGP
jgi:hypothetical protein